ncbi:MAG: hypothetical protein H7317_12350 [Pseudorhodobacter sp.]|nr:hypothetical protein [Pseudorhodobacter sp.]
MEKVLMAFVTIFLTLTGTAQSAGAATVTFDKINIDPFAHSYSENGILVVGTGALGHYGNQNVHLDDGGTDAANKVTFTTGSYFDAVGFDLDPVAFAGFLCDGSPRVCIESFDNVLLSGFDGTNLVASFLFDMGMGKDPYPVVLDDRFKNLTAFSIQVITENIPFYSFCRFESPCSHFEIDNVELVSSSIVAAVPVPASLPLGALGLLGLAALAVRRKRFQARSAIVQA